MVKDLSLFPIDPHGDKKVVKENDFLDGLDLAVGVCGSIAVVEMVKYIRQLRRHGARVTVYATKETLAFISARSLAWASNREVVSNFHFDAGHIFSHDMLLIAPATLNQLAKIANGLADDVICALAQSLLGFRELARQKKSEKNPQILIASCMHISMAHSPSYKNAQTFLQQQGVFFMDPLIREGKYKLPPMEHLCDYVIRAYCSIFPKKITSWHEKNVLITAGSVCVEIDPVRFLANRASGQTGYELARRAFYAQSNVHFLVHRGFSQSLPFPVTFHYYDDYDDYKNMVVEIVEKKSIDIAIFSAAVSDFLIKKESNEKISSKMPCQINLIQAPKVISLVRKKFPSLKMITFKLIDFAQNDVKKIACDILSQKGYDAVVVTDQSILEKDAPSSLEAKRMVAFRNLKKIDCADVVDFDDLSRILFQLPF